MDDRFCIALGAIAVATSDQFFSQCEVIVDFAIENDPYGSVFIANRLMTAGDINDAEPPHTDADLTLSKDAIIIRTAVSHDVAHPAHDNRIDLRVSGKFKHARDPTHTNSPPPKFLFETA